jgi:hypothetical protein
MSRGLVDSKIIPRLWNICPLAFQMCTAQNFNRFMENRPIRDFFPLHSSINNHNVSKFVDGLESSRCPLQF